MQDHRSRRRNRYKGEGVSVMGVIKSLLKSGVQWALMSPAFNRKVATWVRAFVRIVCGAVGYYSYDSGLAENWVAFTVYVIMAALAQWWSHLEKVIDGGNDDAVREAAGKPTPEMEAGLLDLAEAVEVPVKPEVIE